MGQAASGDNTRTNLMFTQNDQPANEPRDGIGRERNDCPVVREPRAPVSGYLGLSARW